MLRQGKRKQHNLPPTSQRSRRALSENLFTRIYTVVLMSKHLSVPLLISVSQLDPADMHYVLVDAEAAVPSSFETPRHGCHPGRHVPASSVFGCSGPGR